MRWIPFGILVLAVALAGCGQGSKVETPEKVRKAVDAYLAERQNLTLSNMSLEVIETRFEGQNATAQVRFRSKQGSTMAVTIQYNLKRSGDGWQVESSSPAPGAGGAPHGTVPVGSPESAPARAPLESSH